MTTSCNRKSAVVSEREALEKTCDQKFAKTVAKILAVGEMKALQRIMIQEKTNLKKLHECKAVLNSIVKPWKKEFVKDCERMQVMMNHIFKNTLSDKLLKRYIKTTCDYGTHVIAQNVIDKQKSPADFLKKLNDVEASIRGFLNHL